MSSTSSPFGQNEWLVEEMYRKFRDDPSSVDPSWHEFLVDYNPEPTTDSSAAGNGQATAAAPVAPPEPAPAPPPAKPAPAKPAPADNGAAKAAPAKAPAKEAPAKAPAPKPAPSSSDGGDESQVLRGAAAAVVKNMNSSLQIPTATSVRAIPAKLMIDNRIVINNHLKRTRGGKVSFTHLLG
ncbi:MAG: 2-oxo acid dehydrogenase subunit E2, partial [Mycolicibacterium aromaticivorans]|nr:2-oxo acid dehydrogenase subunit E2 [Mycolicibacterium aromaticivorans]